MGHMWTGIEAIDKIEFHKFGTKGKCNIVKILERDNYIYAIDDKGRIYTNASIKGNYCLLGGSRKYATVAHDLGLIDKDDYEKYIKHHDYLDKKQNDEWGAKAIVANAEKVGLKLTKAQQSKLDKMINWKRDQSREE